MKRRHFDESTKQTGPEGEGKEKINFSAAINSASLKKMMMDSLGDSKAVARLTSTLISAVAQTPIATIKNKAKS